MAVTVLIRDLEKEEIITYKFGYYNLLDFLEYIYSRELRYKILKIIKREE